ncbi:uncharacterized protein LOC119112270 [Pollicipes pollicipes]|uniref:uncharacterized protein LOC119112270 n=1 Tax=Pollicipes pollicipes TaxID=41117 RepID=UPI001884C75F|nr:uncharacterized protein LOC119112270 [Pollicipes pollicipes]
MQLSWQLWVWSLLLSVLAPLGQSQYWSGYGSGPVIAPTALSDAAKTRSDADLAAAKTAASFGLRMYGKSKGGSNFTKNVASPYKYQAPVFFTSHKSQRDGRSPTSGPERRPIFFGQHA